MNSLTNAFQAVVIGASGGIGSAVSRALRDSDKCSVVHTLSRSDEEGFDLLDEASIVSYARKVREDVGIVDFVFVATGILTNKKYGPEKALKEIDPEEMVQIYKVNAVGPALVMKHFLPLLPRERRSIFATLGARVGSIGENRLGGWFSYRASKAALNQLVKCAAIEISRTRPHTVVAALHPGTIETALSRRFTREFTHSPADCASNLLAVLDQLGPSQTGSLMSYDGRPIPW